MYPTPPDSPRLEQADPRIGLLIADNVRLTKVLGVGAYGTVYQAHNVFTGETYAVKALNKLGLDARQQRFQKREVELHYRASCHPNVLSMYRIIESEDCTYVVLEYCPEGDLFAKITEEGHYIGDDAKARDVFLQLLRAVHYCHSLNIYHRDLKPENIMVVDNGASIRLADFGLATKDSISRDFGCGSTFYMSPECQESNPKPMSWYRSAANDVWSLGVILVNLTCGRNPWKRASMDDPTFQAFRRKPDSLKAILPISDELNTILRSIFEIDPQKRITIPQLIARMEQKPRLTNSYEAPLTPPPDSPLGSALTPPESIVDIHTPCDSPVTLESCMSITPVDVPSLRLPSQRYATPPARPCPQHDMPPSPPESVYGDSSTYPARSHYAYAAPGALAFTQIWNGWNNFAAYQAQQFYNNNNNHYQHPVYPVVY